MHSSYRTKSVDT